jgi:lysozyme family protein
MSTLAYGKSERSIKWLELLQKEIFQALQEWSKALSLWRISAFKGTQA